MSAKSLRNAELIATITFDQLNTYDVLLADDVIFTKAAFDAFVAARSAEGTETVKLSQAVVESDAPAVKPAKKAPKTVEGRVAATEPVEADDAKAGATKTQPYGPGSKAPLASGNAPKGHEFKALEAEKTYVAPGAAAYDETEATVWFDSAESAEAAGFTAQEEN